MSAQDTLRMAPAAAVTRRPRVALMGEFSAGKSTLANLLLGQNVSPVKVTATQLPPIWYSHGAEQVVRVDISGQETEIAPGDLDMLSHRDTQAVRISLVSEVLEFCDIVDMPGISDPNLPSEVWEGMLQRCDAVVWCTPASQAWRQSEAAVWEAQVAALHRRSLLLITRIDKLDSEVDRRRVVLRVRHETDGLFSKVMPISLTEALQAGDDAEALGAAGADRFIEALVDMVEGIGALGPDGAESDWRPPAPLRAVPDAATGTERETETKTGMPEATPSGPTIVPRRVMSKRKRRSTEGP